MKRLLMISFVALFAFVVAAAADDLGELAKKEKARREALEKQGKKGKTLTNADVSNIKSQLAIESSSNTQTAANTQTEPAADATDSNQPQSQPLTVKDQQRLEIEQRQQELEQKVADLEKQKEATQQQIDDARNAVGNAGVYHSANVGNQYQTVSAQEQKLQELDKQIDALRKQQEELEAQKQ